MILLVKLHLRMRRRGIRDYGTLSCWCVSQSLCIRTNFRIAKVTELGTVPPLQREVSRGEERISDARYCCPADRTKLC